MPIRKCYFCNLFFSEMIWSICWGPPSWHAFLGWWSGSLWCWLPDMNIRFRWSPKKCQAFKSVTSSSSPTFRTSRSKPATISSTSSTAATLSRESWRCLRRRTELSSSWSGTNATTTPTTSRSTTRPTAATLSRESWRCPRRRTELSSSWAETNASRATATTTPTTTTPTTSRSTTQPVKSGSIEVKSPVACASRCLTSASSGRSSIASLYPSIYTWFIAGTINSSAWWNRLHEASRKIYIQRKHLKTFSVKIEPVWNKYFYSKSDSFLFNFCPKFFWWLLQIFIQQVYSSLLTIVARLYQPDWIWLPNNAKQKK